MTDDVWRGPAEVEVEVEVEVGALTPWLLVDVWTQPRTVVRTVLDHGGGYGVLLLLMAYGVATIDLEWMLDARDPIVVLLCALSPLFGLLYGVFHAVVTFFSASLLAHPTSVRELLAAVAWGSVPVIAVGLLVLPVELVMALGAEGPLWEAVAFGAVVVVMMGSVWGFVVHVAALAEALRVGWLRALWVWMMPSVALAVLAMLLMVVAFGLVGVTGLML